MKGVRQTSQKSTSRNGSKGRRQTHSSRRTARKTPSSAR
jgi:hypothetical protein